MGTEWVWGGTRMWESGRIGEMGSETGTSRGSGQGTSNLFEGYTEEARAGGYSPRKMIMNQIQDVDLELIEWLQLQIVDEQWSILGNPTITTRLIMCQFGVRNSLVSFDGGEG